MRAVLYEEYGPPDVIQVREVENPAPEADELLIQIHASSVTSADVNRRGFVFVPPGLGPLARLMLGLRKPRQRILGTEFAGKVEAVGERVRRFKEGNQVFGLSGFGANAEYLCVPEDGMVAEKPVNVSYEEAAVIPFGGHTALYFLRERGTIKCGHKVLIRGASGTVGTAAVQLARYFGAEVTGVCSTRNVELVHSLGADEVIDYTQEDFSKRAEIYDLIVDTVVGKTSFSRSMNALRPGGLYLAVAGGVTEFCQMLWTSLLSDKKVVWGPAAERQEDLVFLKELAEQGGLRAVIDRRFPLEQAAKAHEYVDQRRKSGNVAIIVRQGS